MSAWTTAHRLVLGQLAAAAKGNEITALTALLCLLHVRGCIVTIKGMGCQTRLAAQIQQLGGDYVLAVKGDQSALQEDVCAFWTMLGNGGLRAGAHHTQRTWRPCDTSP